MLPDYEGCLELLAAIARQWWKDSERDAEERALLLAWLDLEPAELQELLRLAPRPRREFPADWPRCPVCGEPIPHAKRGKQGRFCGGRCRDRNRKAARAARLAKAFV